MFDVNVRLPRGEQIVVKSLNSAFWALQNTEFQTQFLYPSRFRHLRQVVRWN
eukprot:COSAG02_NODE_446_length_22141_cov_17.963842_18_plen_52_part_00